jgi:hypothetical protein
MGATALAAVGPAHAAASSPGPASSPALAAPPAAASAAPMLVAAAAVALPESEPSSTAVAEAPHCQVRQRETHQYGLGLYIGTPISTAAALPSLP